MKDGNITDSFYLQIQREINKIETKDSLYTVLFYGIRIVQISFAGIITILSGIRISAYDKSTVILVLGAATTAITAIDTLFQIDTKKNTYKLVLFELRAIRSELVHNYNKTNEKYIDGDVKQRLYEKYCKINSYARDLIGTDVEKGAARKESIAEKQSSVV